MITVKLILPGGIIIPAKMRKREIEAIYSRLRQKSRPAVRKATWLKKLMTALRLRKK